MSNPSHLHILEYGDLTKKDCNNKYRHLDKESREQNKSKKTKIIIIVITIIIKYQSKTKISLISTLPPSFILISSFLYQNIFIKVCFSLFNMIIC